MMLNAALFSIVFLGVTAPFVWGAVNVNLDGSTDHVTLSVPLHFHMMEKEYMFEFRCSLEEAHNKLVLMKAVSDFCYESMVQLRPHWIHFYSDPLLCQGDIMNSIKIQSDKFEMNERGVREVDSYTLGSDKWCKSSGWVNNISPHESRVTSQDGQDGVLEYIFSDEAIGSTNKYYVEIGFNSERFDGGSGANTYNLHKNGWGGLLLDIENENPAINLRKHRVTADNVVSILSYYNVPKEPDYVSIDIDSQDLWVLRAIISSGVYRPRVISVEFNANLPFSSTLTVALNSPLPGASVDLLFGASAGALKMVAEEFGYTVVHVINKLDLILVRSDLIAEGLCPVPFFLSYYKVAKVQSCIREPERMFQWWDYDTWKRTGGDEVLSSSAAAMQIVERIHSATPSKSAKVRELICFGVDMDKLILDDYKPPQ